ncbi:MAG: hypothetical protein HUK02_02060 [Bacteroidaceae bacterium]|nr:hypothetical protein [Bacteroidaceae bacterium]
MMNNSSVLHKVTLQLGAILMIVGLVVRFFVPVWACGLFACGVVIFAVMLFLQRYEGDSVVLRRLRSQQFIAVGFLVASAVLMSMQDLHWGRFHHNQWVACLAGGSFILLYTSFRIAQESKKENGK